MNKPILQRQFLAGLGGIIAAAMSVQLVRASFRIGLDAMNGIMILFMTSLAALSLLFAVRGQDPVTRAALAAAARSGMYVGGAALVLGFVGPLVLNPDASCGPLFGIFFTGPLGFVVGATIGLAWHARGRLGAAMTGADSRR